MHLDWHTCHTHESSAGVSHVAMVLFASGEHMALRL